MKNLFFNDWINLLLIHRVFDLTLDTRHMDLFHELSFHNCCVLKIQTLRDAFGNCILLSAGTNGRLAFWNINTLDEGTPLEPFGSLSIHQSGINSFACRWIDKNLLLILSGGDDNALICSEVEVNCVDSTIRLLRQKVTFPHAAQISGITKWIYSFNDLIYLLIYVINVFESTTFYVIIIHFKIIIIFVAIPAVIFNFMLHKRWNWWNFYCVRTKSLSDVYWLF